MISSIVGLCRGSSSKQALAKTAKHKASAISKAICVRLCHWRGLDKQYHFNIIDQPLIDLAANLVFFTEISSCILEVLYAVQEQ